MDRQKIALYFIALIPPKAIRQQVEALKKEMKLRFNAGHALKSPAHITLQMPFKQNQIDERVLLSVLEEFAHHEKPFHLGLNGFSCFEPRVIFVKITDHTSIISLHSRLGPVLIKRLGFTPESVNPRLHPHMTIATRDLKKDDFYLAWRELEGRQFGCSFVSYSIALLKHNGKNWDVLRELPFDS